MFIEACYTSPKNGLRNVSSIAIIPKNITKALSEWGCDMIFQNWNNSKSFGIETTLLKLGFKRCNVYVLNDISNLKES